MEAQRDQLRREGQPYHPGGEAFKGDGEVRQVVVASKRSEPITTHLMEEAVRRENLQRALRRVRANKGSPGVDGMTGEALGGYLREQWPRIRKGRRRGRRF